MILFLPLSISLTYFILKDNDNVICQYSLFSILLYNINISIGINYMLIFFILLITYWLSIEKNLFYTIFILFSSIMVFYANTLYAIFITIELLSFIMITYINLYIQDKYYGILYYLFSGIFTAIFIFAIGYLYIGYNIGYSLIALVFIWKLGLGPFHILMPNIYNSLSPRKILIIDIIIKYLLFYIFYKLIISIPININFIILTSIVIGTIFSLNDNNLLNILVYSSIVNYGLILILINNIELYFIYLIFYSFMVILYIYLIVHINLNYAIDNPYYILLWFILIFNLIGIPPLMGFWIKMYSLYTLILSSSYTLLWIIIISLILISSVYLRILLRFMINEKSIRYINKNEKNAHFIATIAINLIYPLFI